MAWGIVSRFSVAVGVQKNCSLAVEKADELIASKSTATMNLIEVSLPAACKFQFEEVTSSSVVVLLFELSSALADDIKGYKLWYRKTACFVPFLVIRGGFRYPICNHVRSTLSV